MDKLKQNRFSRTAVWLIFAILVFIRLCYLHWSTPTVSGTLTWDAFGYYIYLPAEFIYHDVGQLKWLPDIMNKYNPTGDLYQLSLLPNGNFAMKYLMGLSILYAPFFFLGHFAAGLLGYPQDGFSPPYQLAVCLAALAYALLGLLLLRRVLRHFFSDIVSAVTLLLVALATNYPQYVSIDSGMSHGFLFTMYTLVMWRILKWVQQPTVGNAFVLGLLIGVSCIVRPTEAVMLFLALLWLAPSGKTEQPIAYALWHEHRSQLWAAAAGGFLGILPQLVYWKRVTGDWIFDVGSSWRFLTPHWQVLVGGEKGWFVYTPVTLLFVAGLFLMKGQPFRRSVRTFFILNTWIVLAWADWRYGASYSSRALMQGCAVLALPFALVAERGVQSRFRYLWGMVAVFLIGANLFQIWQYKRTILHYNDNNFAYYRAIYLDPNPSPIDMSLLDTPEILRNESDWNIRLSVASDSTYHGKNEIWSKPLHDWSGYISAKEYWIRISAQVFSQNGGHGAHLITRLQQGERIKQTACRMENAISKPQQWNTIEYWFYVPADFSEGSLSVSIETDNQDIQARGITLKMYGRKVLGDQ